MTYTQACAKIEKATTPTDLFGTDPDAAKKLYRKLSHITHPDVAEVDGAEAVFTRLSALWASYTGSGASDGRFTITTRKRAYAASGALYRSAIATIYPCVWMDGVDEAHGMMKIPRSPRDNDLMEAEARSLKLLAEGDERYHPFVPQLVESFRHRDRTTKIERRINVTESLIPGFVSLMDVHNAYPRGVDPRDVAWMWRRLLTALGYAHECGVVHGAVMPENVLVHPEKHGLVLIDWTYSVPMKTPLKAMMKVTGRRLWYPPEVEEKEPATQATDIAVASRTMGWLMGERTPGVFRSFIRGCTLDSEAMRPHDAWALLREFDDLLERLYGPRKFREFKMPNQ